MQRFTSTQNSPPSAPSWLRLHVHPVPKVSSPMYLFLALLCAGDTGLSSETMCLYFISGRAPERLRGFSGPCYPLDPSDLGRCLRLLDVVPEWRARLAEPS